jgi:hypothetical protein
MSEAMEKTVAELRKLVPFKETTETGDIVLVAAKNPDMIVYAVVTEIRRDETRKHEWWHVSMQLLGIPPQSITWTLRLPQYTGQEIFTMGGEERFIQAVSIKVEGEGTPTKKETTTKQPGTGATLRVLK